MGIFGKTNKKAKSNNATTIIGCNSTIKGVLNTERSVFIDGTYEGIIIAESSVSIGKSGKVIGEIVTKDLTVSGFIDGVFDIENITILGTGKVIGTIHYEEFVIEQSGLFDGIGKVFLTLKNLFFVLTYIFHI